MAPHAGRFLPGLVRIAPMNDAPTFLLLQARDGEDPIKPQEVGCFADVLGMSKDQFRTFDLLTESLASEDFTNVDCVLIGGSGDYSVTDTGSWLTRALDSIRRALDSDIPMFASCWGFQAIAKALGGDVETDRDRAEIGTFEIRLTDKGFQDPLFAGLGQEFDANMGHEDHVMSLPVGAVHLASSDLARHQAYRLEERPVYCTQFHPELNRKAIVERIAAYPKYATEVLGESVEAAMGRFRDTPETAELLNRFVDRYVKLHEREAPCTSPS